MTLVLPSAPAEDLISEAGFPDIITPETAENYYRPLLEGGPNYISYGTLLERCREGQVQLRDHKGVHESYYKAIPNLCPYVVSLSPAAADLESAGIDWFMTNGTGLCGLLYWRGKNGGKTPLNFYFSDELTAIHFRLRF